MGKRKVTVHEKEKKYLEAKTLEEKIQALEEMLKAIPKNKATEKARLNILKRIAKLREELERRSQRKSGRKNLYIKKEAKVLVSLFSFPNTGKSYFLNKYANLNLRSTDIPFETQKPESGIINYNNYIMQFVELPSVYEGYSNKYRYVYTIIRSSDILISFLSNEDIEYQKKVIKEELEKNNIILSKKPDIKIIRENKGGIKLDGLVPENKDLYIKLLQAYGYHHATVYFNEEIDIEMFAKLLDSSTKFIDIIFSKDKEETFDKIIKKLNIIRVYTKEPNKQPDFEEPLILKRGATIKDLIEELNESWLNNFKYAKVWGKKVKFPGQKVGLDYVLEDEDIVELRFK